MSSRTASNTCDLPQGFVDLNEFAVAAQGVLGISLKQSVANNLMGLWGRSEDQTMVRVFARLDEEPLAVLDW